MSELGSDRKPRLMDGRDGHREPFRSETKKMEEAWMQLQPFDSHFEGAFVMYASHPRHPSR